MAENTNTEREAPSDGELAAIYKRANGEDTGKAQPLTTKRIVNAMRAAFQAGRASLSLPAAGQEPVALNPRHLRKFLQALQAGEMSVSRAVEILDAWVGGYYEDSMVSPPPADSCLIADDEFPMEIVRKLRAELSVTPQPAAPMAGQEPVKRVFIVATGEEHEGEATYTRYDDAPPPLCDSECLYAAPQPAVAAGWMEERENLRKALQFYADGHHFAMHDETAWDTVSGEPVNFYEDEAGTATVEDGSIAKLALAGQPIRFEDDDSALPPAPSTEGESL